MSPPPKKNMVSLSRYCVFHEVLRTSHFCGGGLLLPQDTPCCIAQGKSLAGEAGCMWPGLGDEFLVFVMSSLVEVAQGQTVQDFGDDFSSCGFFFMSKYFFCGMSPQSTFLSVPQPQVRTVSLRICGQPREQIVSPCFLLSLQVFHSVVATRL